MTNGHIKRKRYGKTNRWRNRDRAREKERERKIDGQTDEQTGIKKSGKEKKDKKIVFLSQAKMGTQSPAKKGFPFVPETCKKKSRDS